MTSTARWIATLLLVLALAGWALGGLATAPNPPEPRHAGHSPAEFERPPGQVSPTPPTLEAPDTPAPTEAPPTPEPPTPGPPPTVGPCTSGLPAPQLFWNIVAHPGRDRMWVPFHRNSGPYLAAWVKAKYDDVWYTAFITHEGEIVPDSHPPWPRPDLVRFAGSGVHVTRSANPMCPGLTGPVPPPCYAQISYPLVFLNKLAEGGPYLRRTYFWVAGRQVYSDPDGEVSRVSAARYCDPDRPSHVTVTRPVYLSFDGCGNDARRVDTCYER